MLYTGFLVVAVRPLIMVRPPRICWFDVMSTWALTEVGRNWLFIVLHPLGIMANKLAMQGMNNFQIISRTDNSFDPFIDEFMKAFSFNEIGLILISICLLIPWCYSDFIAPPLLYPFVSFSPLYLPVSITKVCVFHSPLSSLEHLFLTFVYLHFLTASCPLTRPFVSPNYWFTKLFLIV